MGLERVAQVKDRLQLDLSAQTVITVAGTNGKGTTCRMMEVALLDAGHTTAVYSSPHLLDYRERVRINDKMLSEDQHCTAFMAVEQARGEIPLTYFEFSTLAAMLLIRDSQAQYVLLEVGLGGRLDAVNVIDPNLAVITSIDLDHQDWLGDTRDAIAIEKAGIVRENIEVVIGEPNPPASLLHALSRHPQKVHWQGSDFWGKEIDAHNWGWHSEGREFAPLPRPQIPIQNVSTALQALRCLGVNLNTDRLADVIERVQLPGRQQVIQHKPMVLLDVAHNPHATQNLAKTIERISHQNLRLVVSMLADKDIQASLAMLSSLNPHWYFAPLDVPRAAPVDLLISACPDNQSYTAYPSVNEALQGAIKDASEQDLVVVFGSFYTVAQVLEAGTS